MAKPGVGHSKYPISKNKFKESFTILWPGRGLKGSWPT